MNKYYCTKCKKEYAVIRSVEVTLSLPCSCSKELKTVWRRVDFRDKADPPAAPKAKEVVVEPMKPLPEQKPVTRLDVSSGPVKATSTK